MNQLQMFGIASLILLTAISVGILIWQKPAPKTRLIYFGFFDHSENPDDLDRMAKRWGHPPPCPDWQLTLKKEEADYQVLFKDIGEVTIIDRQSRLFYVGGTWPLYSPHGNPGGAATDLCNLINEARPEYSADR